MSLCPVLELSTGCRFRANDAEPGKTALVIAGAWDPAILVPNWVLQFGLNRAGSNEPVQMAVAAAAGGFLEFPRYTLPEFAYIVRPDTLILSPPVTRPDTIARTEEAAALMLESLPHTPVNGLGHNFEFRDANPAPAALDVFTRASQDLADEVPEGWNSVGTMIASSFRYADGGTIANIQRQLTGPASL